MEYVPRYIDWKTDYDRCVGGFSSSKTGNLHSWIIPYSDYTVAGLSSSDANFEPSVNPNVSSLQVRYPFMKVNPSIVDPMFSISVDSTVETDHLLNQMFVKCYVTRNLDTNG